MKPLTIIEQLKDKTFVRAFGLMEETLPGSQACYRKVGKNNCLVYTIQGDWKKGTAHFIDISTYAIKPDYQPEPEFVDLKIEKIKQGNYVWLGAWTKAERSLPHSFTHLHCLPSLPNFAGFWYKFQGGKVEFYTDGEVAKLRDEGKVVFARFRT